MITATDLDLPPTFTNGFDKYRDFAPMAKGNKAVLESAYDTAMGRTIAIKRLLPAVADDPRERRRFLREARVTAQLQHPATVPVYEIGLDDQGGIYFTMKKIAGQNLFAILQRLSWGDRTTEQEFPRDVLLGIFMKTSHALAYAHAHGVIHRDVKPENIWVGKFNEVMLLDWGVAKVWGAGYDGYDSTEPGGRDLDDDLDDAARLQTLTITGQRPGTPLYMSPEQVKGQGIIDGRSDIFSMGVMLYEMLTFREPFRGQTIRNTFDNILHNNPLEPRLLAPKRKISKKLQTSS